MGARRRRVKIGVKQSLHGTLGYHYDGGRQLNHDRYMHHKAVCYEVCGGPVSSLFLNDTLYR
jgi:hypothetical protein